MRIDLPHPAAAAGTVPLIANPIKMSATPPAYRRHPPLLGEHTEEILRDLLELGPEELERLRVEGIIGGAD
jgi:crotonobetainyl-CoA:carnitine CoA-transferase CaiB-like acyl-CoA transferase